MRVVVTGADGRLGQAVVETLAALELDVDGWVLPRFDLDEPQRFAGLLAESRPDLVVHTAAWTDVEACAAQPQLAGARNGRATADLAAASGAIGAAFVYVSTNEVFDGRRTDGHGYGEDDAPAPINSYGQSKLVGEQGVRAAYTSATGAALPLARIVRSAWMYGPPGSDFGTKVLAAALQARATGTALRLVVDEIGSPTRAPDLAVTMSRLLAAPAVPALDPLGPGSPGVYHLVNAGRASRAEWAEALLAALDVDVRIEHIPTRTWTRRSTPPAWAVLDNRRAAALGVTLRHWRDALEDELPRYAAWLREAR